MILALSILLLALPPECALWTDAGCEATPEEFVYGRARARQFTPDAGADR